MMKNKRIISWCLALLLFCGMPLNVIAATPDRVQPRFTYIDTVAAGLSIDTTWGIATCTGSMSTCYNRSVKVVVRLLQLKNGEWEELRSWQGTGQMSCEASGTYAIARGYTYCTDVTAYVFNSEGMVVESGVSQKIVVFP